MIRRAFTLVELLVVTAIISLLASLLLPALGRAREQARLTKCLANMRAIGSASHVYAAEDRIEWLIPYHPLLNLEFAHGNYEYGGKSGIGGPTDDATDPVSTSFWGTSRGRGPGTRPLNGIVYKQPLRDYAENPGSDQINWRNDSELGLHVFRCPSDKGFTGRHFAWFEHDELTSFDHFGTSYAANCFIVLSDTTRGWGTGPFLHPLSRIPNASGTYAYIEDAGRFISYGVGVDSCLLNGVFDLGDAPKSEDWSVPKGWHGREPKFALTFVDGHADYVRMDNKQVPAPELDYYPELRAPWFENLHDPLRDGYEMYRCVIVRGDGWQKDSLPSAPIPIEVP